MGVFNANHPRIDTQNSPGGISQLENVTRHTFDGEIFVQSPNKCLAWLQNHPVIRIVRYGSAGGESGDARTAPGAQPMVDSIMMNQSGSPAAFGAEPFRQHSDNFVEFLPGHIPVRISGAQQFKEGFFLTIFASGAGHDLLRQKIERLGWNLESIHLALANALNGGHALHQFVPAQGKEAPLGQTASPMLRPPDTLEASRYGTSRTELANQVD